MPQRYAWLVAALLPVLCQIPLSVLPVWAATLLLGGYIAKDHILRWVALGWIASVLFPATPLIMVAVSGAMLKGYRSCIYAVLFGITLCFLSISGLFMNTGFLLIVIGCSFTLIGGHSESN